MEQQRNLILAIAISLAILLGFQYFFAPPPPPSPVTTAGAPPAAAPSSPGLAIVSGAETAPVRERAAILADVARVHIQSDRLRGSISLAGGRIDDLTLVKFRETVDPGSANIQLLHPAGFAEAYYGEFGWVGDGKEQTMPSADTRWSADRATLTPDHPLTLNWDNGQGLRFVRRYTLDRHYMITVNQRVENSSDRPVKLFPYALVSRSGTPHTEGFYILHEGVVGVMNGTLREHTYSDLKGDASIGETTRGGWLGITDKYWLVALAPEQQEEVKTRVTHSKTQGKDKYQVDYLGEERTLSPGGSAESVHRLFAGAKEVRVLRRYQDDLGITRFDYAVDWGWFFFLTKPIFLALDYIHHLIGNFGIAILLLTVAIKALFFPLANRSYVMMSKMKKLAPKLTELREKCGDDRVRLNQEMMAIYKNEKVNPLSGCLPIILQIPVFFSLYKVLFVTRCV